MALFPKHLVVDILNEGSDTSGLAEVENVIER